MSDVLEKVKIWLEQEIEGQEVIDEYEGGLRPKCTDGTDDMIEGRVESANALLEQIKKWESQETWESLAEQGHSPQMIESILADKESER